MKNLSYTAKFHIFNWTAFAIAVLNCFLQLAVLDTLWTILWGIGLFFWGMERGQRKERMRRVKAQTVNFHFTGAVV